MIQPAGILWQMSNGEFDPKGHCDTMNGPVVAAARNALRDGNLTPVLVWVRADDEPVSNKYLSAISRALPPCLRASITCAKTSRTTAETEVEPGIAAADAAVVSGDIGNLAVETTRKVDANLCRQFARVIELKKYSGESVGAGRAYVAAYVEFIHYVEEIHQASGAEHRQPVVEAHAHE